MKRALKLSVLSAALISAFVSSAHAVVLNPGDAALTPGSNANVVSILASLDIPITGINAQGETKFTGTLRHEVYSSVSGGLIFAYRFTNDASSANAVSRMTMTDFAGFTTNVDWATNSSVPGVKSHSADRSGDGGTIGFNFVPVALGGDGTIAPGTLNYVAYIEVNATDYALTGTTSLIDGAIATVQTYAPVPEPASLAAVGIGLVGVIARRRRK